ncbi:hypothetical protein RHSIM_Rhsim10G0028300 [Rhododendron simsii]|uniref:CRM domain-containing protein n=1 Tax=Rhododendron simsii TaxID=118357 RepID=A0A834GG75_RHOSS|nr:hypothetical protein RHSIM_Rhsim10G0028300 [Rhododendron simsii]
MKEHAFHWKYRELVKVICGGRSIQEVQGIAQTLETESGGILVTVERIKKGFAILVYRGKNYNQPALLSKREALKRSIEAQRHKYLKLYVLKLTRNVDELKLQLAKDKETNKPAKRANFQLARERSGFDSGSFNLNDGTDASTACPETNQQDMLRDSPLLFLDKMDEFDITEPENVSELEREEKRLLMGSIGLGKSNIVTGVAKTIKTHFQRHPLTIVSVKGRAKGTSVQELVSKLEEATGAVLVSHETNKVILYRGWGSEVEPGQPVEMNDIKDAVKTSVGRKGEFRPVISPELLDAIRLEGGFHRTPEEVK